ncbi:prefoldin subunit 1 [Bemisia tabaci]|uniref:prefoldin subunit 1 n=1 Tax=Bemisia tabaci TaxID=7038 RepID=UPI0019476B85
MSKSVDQELKNAFQELQLKMIDTKQKLKLSDVQIDSLKRTKVHSEITLKEIKALSDSIKTYKSIGRMFLTAEKAEVLKDLQSQINMCDEKIEKLESGKKYLERSYKDSENNLREMVQQRRDAVQKES